MSIRDHGYGDPPAMAGPPTIVDTVSEECPHCKCNPVYMVEVVLKSAPLNLPVPEGYHVVGAYLGCAACTWASPMGSSPRPIPITTPNTTTAN